MRPFLEMLVPALAAWLIGYLLGRSNRSQR